MRSNKRDVESSRHHQPQTARKRTSARTASPAEEVPPKPKESETDDEGERKGVKKVLTSNCYTNHYYDHKKRIKCHIWRVIQLILCGCCFIYSVIAINKGFVRTEVPSSYLAIFLITSTALFGVVLIDIVSLLYGRPYFWNSWTMIATCGVLFFFLCAGLVISTEFSSKGFFVAGAILFVLTAIAFLLDLLYLLKFLLYVPIHSECETRLDNTDESTQFPSKIRLAPSDSFIREPPPQMIMAKIIEDEEPEKEIVKEEEPPVIWREPAVVVAPVEDLCVCESSSSEEETVTCMVDKCTNFPTKSTLPARSRQQRTKSAPSTPADHKKTSFQKQQRPSSTQAPSFYRTLEYSHQNQRNQPVQQYYQQYCWRCGQMHYHRHAHNCSERVSEQVSQRHNNLNSLSTIFNSQSAQSTYRFQLFVPPTQQQQQQQQLAICEAASCACPSTSSAAVQTQKRSTTPRKRSRDPSLEDCCKKVDKPTPHPPLCYCSSCKSPAKPESIINVSDSDTSSKAADDESDRNRSDQVEHASILDSSKDSDAACACSPTESPQTLYVHSEVSFYKSSSTSNKNKPIDASKQKKRQ